MVQLENIRNLIEGACDLAVIGLIILALGAILIFFKVFRSDFSED